MSYTKNNLQLASLVKIVIMDVDGIFTNGQIYFDSQGFEAIKAFHAHDGIGIRRLQQQNLKLAIISGRESPMVRKRMLELNINELHLGFLDKITPFKQILAKYNYQPHQVAYIGDDLPDLPCIQAAGLGVSVPNAIDSVKKIANWITPHAGGMGAVRDLCELILCAQT
jgi:3-deoxy-D-manno-octulosonate 8-phosphate phosphatase (KDO 8-P phosphatase)